jgi:nitroreductase
MLRRQTFMSLSSNDKLNFILGRRSVRVYAPGAVSEEMVTRLLEAAMAAPSAMTKDPWRFVVVRNAQTLGQMAAALPGGKMLPTATLALVVCGDMDAVFDRQFSYLLQDCSACLENLLLAAHALDLGACWVGVHPSEDAMRRLRELLALPTPLVPIAVVALGQPGERLEARTRYQREYVRWEQWGK